MMHSRGTESICVCRVDPKNPEAVFTSEDAFTCLSGPPQKKTGPFLPRHMLATATALVNEQEHAQHEEEEPEHRHRAPPPL